VAELLACLEDSITTPDAVAQLAVEHWMERPDLREALLDRWQRIGVGFDGEVIATRKGRLSAVYHRADTK
jgi:hypothetical protein